MEKSQTTEGSKKDEAYIKFIIDSALIDHQYLGGPSNEIAFRNDYNKKKKFVCCYCGRVYLYPRPLSKHILKHHQKIKATIYQCSYCGFEAKTNERLIKHLHNAHLKNALKCKHCIYRAESLEDLNFHFEKEHRLRECELCDFKTNVGEKAFDRHMRLKHGQSFYKEKERFICPFCSYYSHDCTDVRKHIIDLVHDGVHKWVSFSCPYCKKLMVDREACIDHIKSAHPTQQQTKCDLCDFTTYWAGDLKGHKTREHHGDRFFSCTLCEYKTEIHEEFLKRHMSTHHMKEAIHIKSEPEEVILDEYNSEEHNSEELNSEETDDKILFLCEKKCGFSTTDFAKYRSHIDQHIPKVQCELCESIVISESLSIHMQKVHNKIINKQICPFCSFRTTEPYSCLEHIKASHPNKTPIHCACCSTFRSYWSEDVKEHTETEHKNWPTIYKCLDCDYSTAIHPEFLKRHMMTKHNKESFYSVSMFNVK